MTNSPHPGRSVDFLSRLHDGELDPGERARFEAHRAHCAECRRAAAEFEDALSLFRSARSSPPGADLAARILRKVRTPSPSRRFGLSFGVDLGWAALVVTALLALVVTTPIVVRRRDEAPPRAVSEARPQKPAQAVTARTPLPEPRARRERAFGNRAADPPPAAKEIETAEEALAAAPAAAVSAREDRVEAPTQERDEDRSAAAVTAPKRSGLREEDRPALLAEGQRLSVSIVPIDGHGAAPALVGGGRIELPVGERGREYALLVDSQGIVREVTLHSAKEEARGATPEALRQLRFQPGNRPRRLLARIE